MERLRSQRIEPFDFEEANMSDDLWLAEGFTNYYGPLITARAGFSTLDLTSQHRPRARSTRHAQPRPPFDPPST